MKTKEKIIQRVIEIIASNIGSNTANFYMQLYQKMKPTDILESFQNLMEELVGEESAAEVVSNLLIELKISQDDLISK